jgi:hypothetical protein
MRLNFLSALFAFVLLFSCSKAEESPPPIPPEVLSEILAEVLIIEPAGRELAYDLQDSVYSHHYDLILGRRGFTQTDFIMSMQLLQKDPKKLEEVYTEVLERIQIMETEANK